MNFKKALFSVLCLLGPFAAAHAQLPELRVGVLKFGTVNWELNVIKHHKLDEKEGISVKVVPLASKNATHVSIQGGAADIVVTDWTWVSRQRAEGKMYSFVPYSTTSGSLMVHPESGIKSLQDLDGKKLGIAGGPVDKSWLLLRAYSKKTIGEDLGEIVDPKFGAPPLLNQLAFRKEIPAVLNFWHYTARLKAAGYQSLISVPEVLAELDIPTPIPLIGWVFHEDWAQKNPEILNAFIRSSLSAKNRMKNSDEEWLRLEPRMKVEDSETRDALRDAWRSGIADCFDQGIVDSATRLFALLAKEGGKKLVGNQTSLAPGTFWTGYKFNSCQR